MRWNNVCIEATGHVLPKQVVTSAELEAAFAPTLRRLGMPPGQLEALSGVKERRWFDSGTMPSTVSAMAAEKALARAGISVGEVDLLVNTSVSRDYLEPATACMIAGHLKLPHSTFTYDVTNACLGFLNGLIVAANAIELGQADVAVVTCAETVRDGVEATLKRLAAPEATIDTFRDNFAAMTLGEGAAAFVLTRKDRSQTGHELHGGVARSATEHNTLCLGQYMEMRANAHGLLVHGVGLAVETWPEAVKACGWDTRPVDEYVCHQVSMAHFTHAFSQLNLPLEKALLTFPFLGNVGPTSLPLTLALGETQGRIVPGKELALYAVGSGLGCIILGVHW
ncbi:MAG: 3-oxoacyl-[acyl-carrier-protein] synthase-3 [bacterium]|jgi:3-oxoacyl-[acyl-carrier-protein] synthase-3